MMVITATVQLIGARRYVTPVVVTGILSLSVSLASVTPTVVARRKVSLTAPVAAIDEIVPRNLDTITDADGVAFDDGQGGAFHTY